MPKRDRSNSKSDLLKPRKSVCFPQSNQPMFSLRNHETIVHSHSTPRRRLVDSHMRRDPRRQRDGANARGVPRRLESGHRPHLRRAARHGNQQSEERARIDRSYFLDTPRGVTRPETSRTFGGNFRAQFQFAPVKVTCLDLPLLLFKKFHLQRLES
jgi:hypothetical protein